MNPEETTNLPQNAIVVGDYAMWDMDVKTLYIVHMVTGEAGTFPKADFEPYVKAFFGLNF